MTSLTATFVAFVVACHHSAEHWKLTQCYHTSRSNAMLVTHLASVSGSAMQMEVSCAIFLPAHGKKLHISMVFASLLLAELNWFVVKIGRLSCYSFVCGLAICFIAVALAVSL